MSTPNAAGVATPTASSPTLSLFDEMCRRKGKDPESERAAFETANAIRERATAAYLASRARGEEKRPENLANVLAQLAEVLQRPNGPACLDGIQTKAQLKDFLMELLFDEIVSVTQGVFEGMNNEHELEATRGQRDQEEGSRRPRKKG